MFAEERQNAIRKIVREHRRLSFAELQAMVDVSPATLRRDLTDLEKTGDILRVHGGVLDPAYVRSEISLDERVLHHGPAKREIAALAATLVPPGASVFIDAGSTCLEAGRLLLARQDLRIITHSVALLALAPHGHAEVLCIGGNLRRVSGALIGSAALGVLDLLSADIALLGATGLDLQGCSTTEVFEAEMKAAILTRCRRKLLLADASKWLEPSTIRFATWSQITGWVTDKKIPAPDTKALRKQGTEIHVP